MYASVYAMLFRVHRHPKTLGVVVVVVAVFLVVVGVWWTGGDEASTPLRHHHRHHQFGSLDGMNLTNFLDSQRHMAITPQRTLDACSSGGGGGANGGAGGVEVLVVVPSTPSNVAARSAVRESWGVQLPSSWALVFYVGAVERPNVQDRLSAEAREHGDIAQDVTFLDTYGNLTLKTLGLLSFVCQTCPAATLLFKVDDDVYVNVPKLRGLTKCLSAAMTEVYVDRRDSGSGSARRKECDKTRGLVSHYIDAKSHDYESYVLAGYLYRDVTPYRDPKSKWYIPKTSYPKDVLPPFLSGTAYLMSVNILPHLLRATRTVPAVSLEDVYVTGLVASEQLKLRLTHLDGVQRFRPRLESPCAYKTTLTAHGFSPQELRRVTHMSSGVSEGECEGVLTRFGLAVNGILTSFFPRLPLSSSALEDGDKSATV